MWSRFVQLIKSSRLAQVVLVGIIGLAVGVTVFVLSSEPTEPTVPETTTSSTSTTPETTTTTTETSTTAVTGATSQLNGLPVDDPSLLARRVLAVKIDNHPDARPQSGIDQADLVFEYMAEGVTRFNSLWLQSEAEYLGPMRSGRPTDQTILAAFNEPTLAISGGQSWVQDMIRSVGIHLIGEVRPATFRVPGRRAPHNLFTNTVLLREQADSLGYPDEPLEGPIWDFGEMAEDAALAGSVDIDFAGNLVNWTWDEATGTWLRSVDGDQPSNWSDEEGEETQIGFPVLVALYVEQTTVGSLPTSLTAGAGQALVFADGKVARGTWEREDEFEWFRLTDASGNTIPVPAGKVWISLVPNDSVLTYE